MTSRSSRSKARRGRPAPRATPPGRACARAAVRKRKRSNPLAPRRRFSCSSSESSPAFPPPISLETLCAVTASDDSLARWIQSMAVGTLRAAAGVEVARPALQGLPFRRRMKALGAQHSQTVRGTTVARVDLGEGPPVVLLHGLGGSALDWRETIEPLAAAGFRAIAFDILGAGHSGLPADGDYSLWSQAETIREAMRQLELGPVTLIGNSYGGGMTLRIVQKHPEDVASIVLVDSLCYRQKMPPYFYLSQIPILPELFVNLLPTRPLVQGVLRSCFAHPEVVTQEVIEEYIDEVRRPYRKEAVIRTVRALMPRHPERFERAIGRISVPTMILWGDRDPAIPVALAHRLHKEIPLSELRVLRDCGHVPHMERPEETNEAILSFLARHPPATR